MRVHLLLGSVLVISAWAQAPPRFQDYPVKGVFKGVPVLPIFDAPEERRFEAVIRDGVTKGWGVFDGASGKEFQRPGPNFAGHYVLVNFGCGASSGDCLGAAIVDAKTGRVYRLPTPDVGVSWRPYFGVMATSLAPHPLASFHDFSLRSPLAYRLTSRLIITDTCEGVEGSGGSIIIFRAIGCGAHYYRMDDEGLTLIYRIVWDPPLKPTESVTVN
jgi:hypothetical protein